MEDRRLKLHNLLKDIIGNKNVYYRRPEGMKMNYPCIIYDKEDITDIKADNMKYKMTDRYQIVVIDPKPDNEAIKKILAMPMSSYDRHYISDNLNHDVIILYY